MVADAPIAKFVNAIPNPARYKKRNGATLDMLCEAAYKGDVQTVETLLSTGDEDHIFNGDINLHFTDRNALHMAAMAGQEKCVELLLKANADPHVRTSVKEGTDASQGRLARDMASKFNHTKIVKILAEAEKKSPPGWYQADGIGNNRKLYSEPTAKPAPTPAPPAAPQVAKPAAKPPLPVALLFPGQGSQYVNMMKECKTIPEVKDMLEKSKAILGYDILELCLSGPEEKLAETRYCQPAMFIGGLAGVAKLRKEKPDAADRPKCMAGLSLGEYTALCAAGVLNFEDGLRLVKLRGEAMQEAAQVGKQAMLSVVGLERGVMDQLCADAAKKEGSSGVCKVANALFPKGFSCAGTEVAVNTLKEMSEKKGALQAKLLKTSGGFHTSLMAPAQEKLKKALEEALPNMKTPQCEVYMNVTGAKLPAGSDPKVIVDLLNKQLVSPVLWSPLIEAMIKDGVKDFYECGPQKQIKAMMKRTSNDAWKNTTSMEV